MSFAIEQHVLQTDRHKTFFLTCGDPAHTPIIFCHGWPELSISWRHQLPAMAELGLYAIAPDMRGYGQSTYYDEPSSYTVPEAERDMIELLDSLGAETAIWIGHDWGTPVVWSIAQHHPDRCLGVGGICVPYLPKGFVLPELVSLVDREKYPKESFPDGQWEYWRFHRREPELDRKAFEQNVSNTFRALFRAGDPERANQHSPMATVCQRGGWFGPDGAGAPDLPIDTRIITEFDLQNYVSTFERTGFAGAHNWYRNDEPNAAHAARGSTELELPVLFIHANYDGVCDTVRGRLAEPMRANCRYLTEAFIDGGHWLAQERPEQVNSAIANWLDQHLPALRE